jgi:hypothetical protein
MLCTSAIPQPAESLGVVNGGCWRGGPMVPVMEGIPFPLRRQCRFAANAHDQMDQRGDWS